MEHAIMIIAIWMVAHSFVFMSAAAYNETYGTRIRLKWEPYIISGGILTLLTASHLAIEFIVGCCTCCI